MNESLANENILLKNRLEEYEFLRDTIIHGMVVQDSIPVYEYIGAKRSMRHITGRKITLL